MPSKYHQTMIHWMNEMNERIKELAEYAGMKLPFGGFPNYDEFDFEKFAQLIVQECIGISTKIDKNPYIPDHDQAKKIIREIKRHFGVKE